MRKDIENKCRTCTACMSSDESIKYHNLQPKKNQTTGIDRA